MLPRFRCRSEVAHFGLAPFHTQVSEVMSYFFRRNLASYESVDLDETGATVDVRASMRYLDPVPFLPDVLEMTAHPLEAGNRIGSGPLFDFRVQAQRVGDQMKVDVSRRVSAGFRFVSSGMYSSISMLKFRLCGSTARRHGLLGGRSLLSGCSPRPGDGKEPSL